MKSSVTIVVFVYVVVCRRSWNVDLCSFKAIFVIINVIDVAAVVVIAAAVVVVVVVVDVDVVVALLIYSRVSV